MVTNEIFIDSATLRENVVSLARNIGYLPRSRRSARISASFTVSNLTNIPSVTLKKGLVAVTSQRFGNSDFIFSIPEDVTVPVNSKGVAQFFDIVLYEGSYLEQSFTVSSRNPDQKFILPNTGVDTTTINVTVNESSTSTTKNTYKLYNSLIDVGPETRVYFIQEIDGERYELLFGDGIIAKKLEEPNEVNVGYIVSSGANGNSISNLTFAGSLVTNNGTPITQGLSFITVDGASIGGAPIESVDSIKKYGPQVYASQNRAVTAADYEALIPRIYPEAESVSAYGGEELNPPQYGKVFISIKPRTGEFLPNLIKENIKRDLKKYAVAGIVPEILDLKYLYVEVTSKIYYNTNQASSAADVSSIIQSNVESYADSSELNKYGARFKYSKFLKIIDDSHESVTSNITTVSMRRDARAALNTLAEYSIGFGNQFHISRMSGYNIRTSAFRVAGITQNVYLGDIPDTNRTSGSLFLFTLGNPNATDPTIVRRNVGRIDYTKGIITLNPINIQSTQKIIDGQSVIQIVANPQSNDIVGLQDLYLQLDVNNSTFEMVTDSIASGLDPSASSYIVSSSYDYNRGLLVRP